MTFAERNVLAKILLMKLDSSFLGDFRFLGHVLKILHKGRSYVLEYSISTHLSDHLDFGLVGDGNMSEFGSRPSRILHFGYLTILRSLRAILSLVRILVF